jgi:hypothetical protein
MSFSIYTVLKIAFKLVNWDRGGIIIYSTYYERNIHFLSLINDLTKRRIMV